MNHPAWLEYRKYQEAFDAAGIPWNKKGSPHKLRLQALEWLSKVPYHVVVNETIRLYTPQLVENITMNNALLTRLTRKP